MRARIALVFFVLFCLTVPLIAADKPVATLSLGNPRAEALFSFSWGLSNTTASGGGGGSTGKVTFQDLHFTKQLSQLSKTLFMACVTGQHFDRGVIVLMDGKGNAIGRVELTDVMVTSYQVGGSNDFPMEEVSLSYAKVDYFILIGM